MKVPVYTSIRMDLDEGLGLLELNAPPSNKMTLEFFREFSIALEFIKKHDEFKALVICGHGRHFSSGADLTSLLNEVLLRSKTDKKGRLHGIPAFLSENYKSLLGLERLPIPVIAAIRGVCLGSALELALFSHFRICSEDAVFGLPEASFNLVPGLGGIFKLACITGEANALSLVLRGSTFRAEDALKYKIVDKIEPRKELMTKAFDFAKEVIQDFRMEKRRLYIKKYLS